MPKEILKDEILKEEELDQVAGGTTEESKLFRKVAVEKGWALSEV